ncbi:N-acetylglucosamine-6-phosphate deacetylase [Shimazuella sp. AN120528]|uniref:N-acetylglucosamine-6-phosphate deacetylase n=1 Tax=Shimazuella soli TaxID=1892854 RepID=UPI001F103223|nr:N-acetylglucosamine-6-phosphate deacetylase [Shimazuella soli]MCH5586449.1 N-acetylglucosamine-6-phosphate deacetylase [Shimazuella soli]
MSKTALLGKVITKHHCIDEGIVVAENTKIVFVGNQADYDLQKDSDIHVLNYPNGWIIPGLIDIHVHGNANFDVMDGKVESLYGIAKSLSSYGVTSFLATTMTMPIDQIIQAIHAVMQYQQNPSPYARLIGVHLEGPFISPKRKGAQKEEDILHPTHEKLEQIQTLLQDKLKVVTIAPEIPHALETIKILSKNGIICSIGHSDATEKQVKKALDSGATHFTHLFNAMRELHHREPGVVGSALIHHDSSCDIIADMIHVHPSVVRLVFELKTREKLLLISDGMRAVGMGDGIFHLGGQKVNVHHCIARLDDGSLAGSTLTLNKAVQNMANIVGTSLVDAVYMASTSPAKKLGIDHHKGSLEIGKDADIVVLSDDFNVNLTMIEGQIVHQEDHQ